MRLTSLATISCWGIFEESSNPKAPGYHRMTRPIFSAKSARKLQLQILSKSAPEAGDSLGRSDLPYFAEQRLMWCATSCELALAPRRYFGVMMLETLSPRVPQTALLCTIASPRAVHPTRSTGDEVQKPMF
mmetsp:Transcript_11387/g.28300  ORF Transcript_11387/g.28300 Transcript_11387/m.28300 type:complete len:131 (-) Transcript_11387:242-634(-)